jgi:hypothetical protein
MYSKSIFASYKIYHFFGVDIRAVLIFDINPFRKLLYKFFNL